MKRAKRRTVIESVSSDVDDAKHGHCDLLTSWWNFGQKPIDRTIVGHTENKLICEGLNLVLV